MKDIPNTSQGFRFVACVVLEIPGVVHFNPSPLGAWYGYKTLGTRRVKLFVVSVPRSIGPRPIKNAVLDRPTLKLK